MIRGPLPERWQSGRMYLTRNQACVQAHRGFDKFVGNEFGQPKAGP